ncbi:family 43 glycosylhydrolase [Litchfieldia alkalitelluris]|uniref:family 43 glycosylhydrolase n=1 Tax=Litchfieldia alkalitelluris TaxID=304268 RepID=UPI00195E98D8|nr:family 43 glycosylhydrolase [Litchfieldia alkalitelluris]
MKNQCFNPYLPSYEYIPDGEPYVFGDRLYVYGSHDRFNGKLFCMNNYVCWSAPVNDLSDWRYEGVIYKKNQDPMNKLGLYQMYAPDVAKGKDGRYYLYYTVMFQSVISVAVCDTPAGTYEFYGYVGYPDGRKLSNSSGDPFLFDPGVLVDDDGSVYLYSGFAPRKGVPRFLKDGRNGHLKADM